MSAETATRERVVLAKLKGAERTRAAEALRRASGPWYLELLEAQTAHLRPVDSKRPEPRQASPLTRRAEPCPCGCGQSRVFVDGITPAVRAHLREHPHPPSSNGGRIRFAAPLPDRFRR